MITGRLEGDHDDPVLIIERDFAASVEEVWSAITDPDQLALWYGTWSGEPASGEVTVQMLFEEGEHQAVWFIDQCDPPSVLEVRSAGPDGQSMWTLRIELQNSDIGTRLIFSQPLPSREWVREIGAGWEFYLDRLVDSFGTGTPSDLQWSGHENLMTEYEQEFLTK